MFRTDQIINSTELNRNFAALSKLLRTEPQALLITQKRREFLVLVNAEIFEELVQTRFELDQLQAAQAYGEAESIM